MSFFGSLNNNVSNSQRHLAFTLAEVLITLGIIGVVAALTIPTIISSAEKISTVSKVEKAYSMLSQATLSVASENGDSLENIFTSDPNVMYQTFLAKFKVAKACANTSGCFPANIDYYNIQKSDIWGTPIDSNSTLYKFVLADGSLIFLWDGSAGCKWTEGSLSNLCADVGFDINGSKGPNIAGKDLFEFYLKKNGTLAPFGSEGYDCSASSRYCSLKLLTEHKITYY